MANKITLKQFVAAQKEAAAAGAIIPGYLVELKADGELQAHSTGAGDINSLYIAKADDYIGKGIDEDYASGDQVRYEVGHNGEEYNMLLAVGESVTKDDLLESAGDGTLQADTGSAARLKAAETVDNSGGSEAVRIKVEVIK